MINKLNRNDNIIVMIDKINEIIDFLNDTYLMKEKDGQYITINDECFITGTSILNNNNNNIVDNVDGVSRINTCPHCGKSYYEELYNTTTAVYYPPIYKNGVSINPDKNKSSVYCRCLNCGKEFDLCRKEDNYD